MTSFDVVVVGAGLAGLQATRLLARRGASVLLIDRKRSLTESVHTTGIFVRRTLEDFDLPVSCLGPPVRHVILYSPARRALELESQRDEFRVGRMARLYEHMLQDALRAGATWFPSTRYLGLEDLDARGSIVHFSREGRAGNAHATYVIGADGASSRVARDLGLDANRDWIVGIEDVYENVPLHGVPSFHCFLDPRLAPGYLAWVVHDGEETHVGVGGHASRFEPLNALKRFRASVENLFDFRNARRLERRGGRIPVGGVLKRIANEHGLLVGDAAGAVSPLTAGGLDGCMRLSSLAAEVAGDYTSTRERRVLERYSGKRFRERFVSRLFMRRTLSAIYRPSLLEAICAAMRTPPFSAIARHVFFGRGSFPDPETDVSETACYQIDH